MAGSENNGSKKFEEALELLNEAARDKKEELQSLMTDKYSEIQSLMKKAQTQGRREVRRVKRQAEDWIEENGDNLKESVSDLDESVRENPWPYLGGVALGALLIGVLLGSSSRNK